MKPDDERRPVDPRHGRALEPRPQPGYYPKYSTLSQQAYWDAATRETVLKRVNAVPPVRFFTPAEAEIMQRVIEHVLPQDDRTPERRIPILPFIDERLFQGRTAGYRFEDMPPDGGAYRRFLRAVDLMALAAHGEQFLRLGWHEADVLLKSLHDAKPLGAEDIWKTLPVKRFWTLLVQDCAEVYYAHPWAWDEIGFGGPAYPRAYFRLEGGAPEPWEKPERRYEWGVPPASVSDLHQNEAAHADEPAQGETGSH